MILGRDRHVHAACFDELEAAISDLRTRGIDRRPVCLNAHSYASMLPEDAIVLNTENVGLQVAPDFSREIGGRELWDVSGRNVERWRTAGRNARLVDLGYHPSMLRFQMQPVRNRWIDVLLTGAWSPRRGHVLERLRSRGIRVVHLRDVYGRMRDRAIASAKLVLNLRFFDDAFYPVVRALHLVANGAPMLSEESPEIPSWIPERTRVSFEGIVDRAVELLDDREGLEETARLTLESLCKHPMRLPS